MTYSNAAKRAMLNVRQETLNKHGAVSEEVAEEMAVGALKHSDASIALSITGIAGPGGSEFKPEGRVCFGLATTAATVTCTVELGAVGRANVRQQATDFAGGIVVHETAGLAALVIAVLLGARSDKKKPPHNPGYVMIGASMLWVGWFGFNGGSQLAADGGAAMALTVTHISAATASLSWALWERIKYGKSSMVSMVTGTIAGLASITPASGSVGPAEALLIGAIAGVLCQEACGWVKSLLNIDDTLDVFAVHGLGGMFGILMLAALGHASWIAQAGGIIVVGVFTVVMTFAIAKAVVVIFPIRVSQEDEFNGLDITAHGERAYDHAS